MVDREYLRQEAFTSHPKAETVADPPRPQDEISLVEIASLLLRQRRLVFRGILLSTGISLIIALTRPTEFTSSASFLPESNTGSSVPSGAFALAQQFGFAVGGGAGGERSPQFYANLVTSKEILRQVVTRRYSLSPAGEGPEETDLIVYYEVSEDTHEQRIERAIESFTDDLSVGLDRETGIVSFSVRTSDPILSRGVAALILELVNDFDLTTRQSQASSERLFSGGG